MSANRCSWGRLNEDLAEGGGQDDALQAGFAAGQLLEGLADPVHGPRGDERPDPYLFAQDLVQDVRIMLWETAPGSSDLGVESHQPREMIGERFRAVADDHEHPSVSEKLQGRLLAGPGAAHLEDLPARFGVEAVFPAQGPELLPDVPRRASRGREAKIEPASTGCLELFRVPTEADDHFGTQELGPLSHVNSQPARCAHHDDLIAWLDPASERRLVWGGHRVGHHR